MRKIAIALLAVVPAIVGISGCGGGEKAKSVNLSKRAPVQRSATLPRENPLRIAVGAMITPKEGFAYYRRLFDYIEGQLGMPVKLVDRENYRRTNNLMETGDIDVAFVCGRPYVEGHDAFGMELLVAPQVRGETVYHSVVVVRKSSPIEGLKGLRGKRFAFVDPLSNTGKLAQVYALARMGETPDSYFGGFIHTYAHDKSIKAVAQGIVDGAAVDNLIWEYVNRTDPGIASKTRVIERSPPYGIPPVVVRPGLAPELKERLRQVLLNVHANDEGRQVLEGMMVDRFVLIDDSAYDTIREMKSWLAERENKEQGQRQR